MAITLFLLWCTVLVPSLKNTALIFLEIFLIECCTVLVERPKTKKDIPKKKTPFLFTLKSLSNKQQLFFYFIGTLEPRCIQHVVDPLVGSHLKFRTWDWNGLAKLEHAQLKKVSLKKATTTTFSNNFSPRLSVLDQFVPTSSLPQFQTDCYLLSSRIT